MGFFDNVKNFVGGHGVTVKITDIEDSVPEDANLYFLSTELMGEFEVHITKQATILSHDFRLTAYFKDEGVSKSVIVADGKNKTEYETEDEVIVDSFILTGIDLADAMRRLELDADAAVNDPRISFELQVWADVKGTPIDASAKAPITVVDVEPVVESAPAAPVARAWDWKARIDEMMAALEASESTLVRVAEVGEPVSQSEIDEVHATLGYELDPRFLDFFRAANGIRLIWVTSYFDAVDDSISHYHSQVDMNTCGRINVPPLRELFEQPDYLYGWDMYEPKQYTERCLGGWDAFALRSALRNIDDFEHRVDDSSFNLLGLVASERYPDPPVIYTNDYVAALSDAYPMLARDYLAFVIATLGRPQERYQRLKSRGAGGNHELFIPQPGWLDALPTPAMILAVMHDEVSLEENNAATASLEAVATQDGVPVAETPYASYNEAPVGPPRVVSEDPLEGMRVADITPEWNDYLRGMEGQLTMPLYDESHYIIKTPLTDAASLRELIGQPVKVVSKYGTDIGCLIKVEDDGGTLFSAGDGYMGTSGFGIDGSEIGRAWYLK